MLLHRRIAIHQPVRLVAVGAVLHEGDPVAVRHRAVGDLEGFQPGLVARPFAIVGESRPVMADLHQAALVAREAERRLPRHRHRLGVAVGREQRVVTEPVEKIGHQELLVLHLVVASELRHRRDLLGIVALGVEQQRHRLGHVGAVVEDRLPAGARDEAAFVPRVARPGLHVVGVEEVGEAVVWRGVFRVLRLEDELLEKPRRVGEVPFDRARILHALQHHVLGRQWHGKGLRPAAGGFEQFDRRAGAGGRLTLKDGHRIVSSPFHSLGWERRSALAITKGNSCRVKDREEANPKVGPVRTGARVRTGTASMLVEDFRPRSPAAGHRAGPAARHWGSRHRDTGAIEKDIILRPARLFA